MSERTLLGHPLYQLTKVRFFEFWREPEAVFWTFLFPVLLASGLGIAFRNRAPDVIKIAIVDRAAISQQIAEELAGNPGLSASVCEEADCANALRTGKVALLVIPQSADRVTYRFDETNPDGRSARALTDDSLQRAAGRADPVKFADEHVTENGSRYIDFLVPGLLAMNLMGNGIWGICFPIIDARRKKLLKRMVAAPMSRAQYLLSYLLSRLAFVVLDVFLFVGFGHLAFHVPVRGSIGAIALICFVSALEFSSIGLLIGSRVSTTEGASGLANAVMVPMWIVCGVFFSARRFPGLVQPIIHALPLSATVDSLRAVMLEGATLVSLRGPLTILTVWLVVCFTCALRLFRWR
jgi:ABC-2 type transport system permease protein